MKNISIVIPVWNEEGNIKPLVSRIHQVMVDNKIKYELIFIDDHSLDKTISVIQSLQSAYPISVFVKEGSRGKAQSLLEGFSYTKFDTICMIDADLQYPPEYIPQMLAKIDDGVDIVVANRASTQTSVLRNITSKAFALFFVKFLNGLNFDAQSGLKVFKKEIVERLVLSPTPWAFDLEFLKKSLEAGYTIDTVDIEFEKRNSGNTKINILQASSELALNAIKVRCEAPKIIPFHKSQGEGFHFKGNPFVPFTNLKHTESAIARFKRSHLFMIMGFVYLYCVLLFIDWHAVIVFTIGSFTLMYFIDLLFNLFLIYRSFVVDPEIKVTPREIKNLNPKEWPMYTIFCPLYKEWNVVPQFIQAMSKLDYPKNKLQVMLLLEEDDSETITKVSDFNLPPYIEVVVVPDSQPKTKPKALNYGLRYAKGDYAVIYDAEDVPERDQIKKAVVAFNKIHENIVCIQAKLNFYNPTQNLLTRLFTAEYSLWFDLVLTGLQSINAPIPLGGTSNHFRLAQLKLVNGWDSFNVTEDADLGMRLVKAGYKTAILDSTTYEEANSSYTNWFNQRSRWIKGYIQTYFVHMRNPRALIKDWNDIPLISFNMIIGGKILSMFINPFMWLITLCYFLERSALGGIIESLFPGPVLYIGALSLFFGNFLYFYYYLIGCAKREYDDIIKYLFLVPIYWLAMSAATWKASIEFIYKPFYWSKTKHGLHLGQDEDKPGSMSMPLGGRPAIKYSQ